MELNRIIQRTLIIFWFLFFIQVIFFLILEDLYPYTIFSTPTYFYNFYLINLLLSAIFIIFIIYMSRKKNDVFFSYEYQGLNIDNALNFIIIITSLGIILSLIAKYILYGDKILSGFYYGNKDINCLIINVRHLWLENRSLISNDDTKLIIYNILSPVGTILINFFYILIFCLFFFKIKIKKKIICYILIALSLITYMFITGSKNTAFNTFSFIFALTIICLIIKKLNFNNLFLFIFFSVFTFLVIAVVQIARTECSISGAKDKVYNTKMEFKNSVTKFGAAEPKTQVNLVDMALSDLIDENDQKKNISNTGKYILYKKNYDSIILKKLVNTSYLDDVNVNYTLFYLLTGKVNGEYMLQNVDRPLIGNVILSKTLNVLTRDFKKNLFDVKVNWPKSRGGISFLHLLWYDFGYFGILIFITFLFICLNVTIKNQIINFKSKSTNSLVLFYILAVFFYIFVQFFNWYALETINSRFIFFNLLIFIFYLNYKLKKT